jgi:hypothetical protein
MMPDSESIRGTGIADGISPQRHDRDVTQRRKRPSKGVSTSHASRLAATSTSRRPIRHRPGGQMRYSVMDLVRERALQNDWAPKYEQILGNSTILVWEMESLLGRNFELEIHFDEGGRIVFSEKRHDGEVVYRSHETDVFTSTDVQMATLSMI